MRVLKTLILCFSAACLPGTGIAVEKPFTGVFSGTGRACSGALHVRAKTIEWNSTYSICKSTQYRILEKESDNGRQRVVFQLNKRSTRCRYPVIEVEHQAGYNWNVSGYQSLEGFSNRNSPDWRNSPLPERQILSCPMIGPDEFGN